MIAATLSLLGAFSGSELTRLRWKGHNAREPVLIVRPESASVSF
jgi:hypothetical protein